MWEISMRMPMIVALAAALCGCADGLDGSVVSHNYYNSAYEPGQIALAAASGPSLAVIRNNPFPEDQNNEGVLAAMQGRNLGPRMYFTQTPRPDDKYGYKVILSFNGVSSSGESYSPSSGYSPFGYNAQCQAQPTPPSTGRLTDYISVTGTFCVGNLLLTDASASVSGATGPDDPRFKRLIGDMMVALTPPYLPHGGHKCNLNC
jgi:hypothetical protein